MKTLILTLLLMVSNTIQAKDILIGGPMTDKSMDTPIFQLLKAAETSNKVRVLINSTGGYTKEANKFIDVMKRLQAKGVEVTCVSDGATMSAAFFVFIHCDKKYVTPKAVLMIHDPYYTFIRLVNYKFAKDFVDDVHEWREEVLAKFPVTLEHYEWLAARDYYMYPDYIFANIPNFIDGLMVKGEVVCSQPFICRNYLDGFHAGREAAAPFLKETAK